MAHVACRPMDMVMRMCRMCAMGMALRAASLR